MTVVRQRGRSALALARAARTALDRIPPLTASRPRELARISTLAMITGDWPVAVEAARARLRRHPADEGARVALAVALWELGRDGEARAVVRASGAAGVRFHHHVDDPAGAQAALETLPAPRPELQAAVGDAWRRHGDLERALAAGAPPEAVLAERAVVEGRWAPERAPERAPRVAGRVLHLLEWSLPQRRSGSTYRSGYVVAAQAAAGLDPHVVTQPGFAWRAGGASGAVDEVGGIPHHRLERRAPAGAPLDARLRDYLDGAARVVEQLRPAILHAATDYVNALVALELGRRYGIPVVYEVRSFPEATPGRWANSSATQEKSVVRRRLEAQARRSADRVVTLAEVMKAHIAAEGVEPDRIAIVPNAVDAARFVPREPDPELGARLGLRPGALVLGYASALVPYEGVATLLEAVARLTAEGRAVHGLVVGDGLELPFLRRYARRLGIADRVALPGRVPHEAMAAHYALMDVFVVPRRPEEVCRLVTPLKPYEAMAAALPVVVPRLAALEEVILGGRLGETYAPGDAADLARVVAALDDDPARRERLGREGREWVAAHRTWAANGDRYVALYEALGAA